MDDKKCPTASDDVLLVLTCLASRTEETKELLEHNSDMYVATMATDCEFASFLFTAGTASMLTSTANMTVDWGAFQVCIML